MPCRPPRWAAAWPTRPTRSAARRDSGCATWSRRWDTNLDPDPNGQFIDAGASTIYRENGKRMIAIKFSVRGRDLGSAVDEAKEKTKDLFQIPYRAVWSGEFEQMEEANGRLMWIIPLSLALIFILLYSAFRSILDTIVIFSNVFDVAVGGIWSLYLTGTNFSISAAVGFVSLFGIAIMDGLLLISYFNALRARACRCRTRSCRVAGKRVRPVMMTALTAILGLLPAAVSTKIGGQTAQPLAIVVVGGMTATLFLDTLPDAGALQLLRPPRAAGRGRGHGPLMAWALLGRSISPAACELALPEGLQPCPASRQSSIRPISPKTPGMRFRRPALWPGQPCDVTGSPRHDALRLAGDGAAAARSAAVRRIPDDRRVQLPWPQPSDPQIRVEHRLAEGDPAEEILRLSEALHATSS